MFWQFRAIRESIQTESIVTWCYDVERHYILHQHYHEASRQCSDQISQGLLPSGRDVAICDFASLANFSHGEGKQICNCLGENKGNDEPLSTHWMAYLVWFVHFASRLLGVFGGISGDDMQSEMYKICTYDHFQLMWLDYSMFRLWIVIWVVATSEAPMARVGIFHQANGVSR